MEALNLNLIPGGSSPVVHVSQYDIGRVFRFNLFEGAAVYTLDGTETIECNIRKLDGNIVTVGVTNTSSDYIEVVTTEQMTAVYGTNYGEIVIRKNGNVIGTTNFILQTEQSPIEGGIASDTAIYNLETQVAGYVAQDVADQYDSANVIFDNTPVQGHGNGYTVTSEGIGTALDTKQDNITTKTASGSLIHITDGGDNIPMKSLESEIVAVESGSGEKSPDNPYTISGHTEANVVVRASKNFFDKTTVTNGYRIGADGNPFPQEGYSISDWIETVPNIPIVANVTFSAYDGLAFYDSSKTFIERITSGTTVRVPTNAKYIRVAVNNSYLNTYQLQYGTTSTTYEAYSDKINTYTFTFGQTVYGGYLNVKTGELTITHGVVDLGSLTWAVGATSPHNRFIATTAVTNIYTPSTQAEVFNGLCSDYVVTSFTNMQATNYCLAVNINSTVQVTNDNYSDPSDLKDSLSGVVFVYKLATPTVVQLSPTEVTTLSGENNIFSNCGDTAIEYFPNSVDGLVTLINEFTVTDATELPISDSDPTDTKSYIDTGLSAKQNANVLNIVKHYDSGTSSDALTDLITTYGAVNMVFAFDVPLGYFTGCLTFANDNMGSGFIVLSTTGRFWVVSYVSGTITLTELT